ncbi:MAG: tripartite tricarboxylate transporter permease [Candidatus Woesearchaeota archaeon]
MLAEVLVSLFLGVILGTFTGITPGLHVNLVSLLLLSFSPVLLQYTSPIVLCVFIIALAMTQTFMDALPGIYLGAPDESQALNILPGHRLLLKGEGHNAVVYNTLGSLGCVILGLIFFPLFIWSMGAVYTVLKGVMGYLLAIIMAFMIGRESKWLLSLTAFLTSGALGLIVLSIPSLHQPLFPLLSGMFGFSLLLSSLNDNTSIPTQKEKAPLTITNKNVVKSVSAATGMGFVSAFLPGFGNSQAAIVATNIVGDIGDEGFLTMVGGLNTASMLISIAAAYILDKARNGAIVVVKEIAGTVGWQEMLLFLGVALVASGLGAIISLRLSKLFAKYISKVNYRRLIWGILVFITLLTFYFDGFVGLVILAVSTSVGLVAAKWGIGKNHLMGCLIVPVILYFIL